MVVIGDGRQQEHAKYEEAEWVENAQAPNILDISTLRQRILSSRSWYSSQSSPMVLLGWMMAPFLGAARETPSPAVSPYFLAQEMRRLAGQFFLTMMQVLAHLRFFLYSMTMMTNWSVCLPSWMRRLTFSWRYWTRCSSIWFLMRLFPCSMFIMWLNIINYSLYAILSTASRLYLPRESGILIQFKRIDYNYLLYLIYLFLQTSPAIPTSGHSLEIEQMRQYINMKYRIFQITTLIYLAVLALLYWQHLSQPEPQLRLLNDRTAGLLAELVKTKYFKILRLNLNSECPMPLKNQLCKSKSCAVCRCDEKDIPQMWIKTDKVISAESSMDVWSKQRENSREWVWHVEDEENDKGEYFDVEKNVESYSGYNGSYIWKLIYEENCFGGNYQEMCLEEKVMYKIVSGLHTSISSHLSRLHKNITTKVVEWADKGDEQFYFNHEQYRQRVVAHPDRIDNLLFLYELLVRAVQQIVPYLEGGRFIMSEDIGQDLKATQLLDSLITHIKQVDFLPLNQTDTYFFVPNNSHVKQYQRYIHNISNILNCVECEKCRLFGKMQTYGIGTALKIILGYNTQYKRNEIVALFNTLNKISISVHTYYNYTIPTHVDTPPTNTHVDTPTTNTHVNASTATEDGIYVKIWGSVGLILVIFVLLVENWNGQKKVKKIFKNVFPKSIKLN